MSGRLPVLVSTRRRSSDLGSSRLKPKSNLPDSPFLPKIGRDTNRSNHTNNSGNDQQENECKSCFRASLKIV